MVKNLPAKQEMQVRSLGLESPLEKGMATHSSTLAWEIPWSEDPGGLQSVVSQRVGHNLATKQQQQLQFNIFNISSGVSNFFPCPGSCVVDSAKKRS